MSLPVYGDGLPDQAATGSEQRTYGAVVAAGGRSVLADEALAAGVPPKEVWRAVWAALELPARDR